jgi:Mn2+/Fe2+ NRAMP family transporter
MKSSASEERRPNWSSELRGHRAGLGQAGDRPALGSLLSALALIVIVLTGSYRRWERTVVFLCVLDLAWFWIAFRLHPPLCAIARGTLIPSMPPGGLTPSLMFLTIAFMGTTVAPCQLFFQQSCIADKRLRFADVGWARLDTFLGACITVTAAGCMVIAGAASQAHGFTFTDPARWPSISAATWAARCARRFRSRAPGPTAKSGAGRTACSLRCAGRPGSIWSMCCRWRRPGGIVLIPGAPLQPIILGVQVPAGVMLPSAIVFLQLLPNDKEPLGEHANKRWNNIVNWTIIVVLFALSPILAAQVAVPNLFPK